MTTVRLCYIGCAVMIQYLRPLDIAKTLANNHLKQTALLRPVFASFDELRLA